MGFGDIGSTDRQRMTVQYNEQGDAAGLPTALFMKAALSFSTRVAAGLTGTIACECEFYNIIRPQLSIEAPISRYANQDAGSCRAIIILEDLVATKGARFCDPTKDYISRPQAEVLVNLLADFHGRYMDNHHAQDLLALPTWEETFAKIVKVAMISTYGHKGLLAAADLLPPGVLRRSKEVWPATLKATQLGLKTQRTLTHGDVHIKNWYFTDQGSLGLSDWQTCARGPFTRDLAYAISAALTVEDRREWERDLLTLYLERINEISGIKIPFESTFLSYRQQMFSALALWTPTLRPPAFMPAMQPENVSREYIKRFTHAIEDLDSFDAVSLE